MDDGQPQNLSNALRLILVDDDQVRAAAVEEGLLAKGFEVLSVIPTAAGLLYQLAQLEPDAVIISLDSPDRDILESLSIASAHNPRPVVMFSESGDQRFISEAIRAGVTAYQAEGINADRVRMAIDVATAQFSAFNEIREELDKTRKQLESRKVVDRAKGLLMQLKGVSEEEAYNALRTLAMEKQRTLAETAADVITLLGDGK